jgi:hypothetical protein
MSRFAIAVDGRRIGLYRCYFSEVVWRMDDALVGGQVLRERYSCLIVLHWKQRIKAPVTSRPDLERSAIWRAGPHSIEYGGTGLKIQRPSLDEIAKALEKAQLFLRQQSADLLSFVLFTHPCLSIDQ